METVKAYLPLLSLVIAALAVIVGPYVSFRVSKNQQDNSLKLANKQVIAPMRQAWINSLRDQVSEFLSLSLWFYISGMHDENVDFQPDDEGVEEDNQKLKTERKLSFLQTKIEFMLNPSEKDHALFITHLSHCKNGAITSGKNNFSEHHKAASALCKKILKREWERVKSEM